MKNDNYVAIPKKRSWDFSASELLDKVLEELVIRKGEKILMRAVTKAEILYNALGYNDDGALSLFTDEFWAILDKLEKEGFIKKENNKELANEISITFDGLFFVKDGGYQKKEQKDKDYWNQLESLKLRQIDNDQKSVDLTWLLMLWTGIAAFYYTQEILAFYFPKDRKFEIFLCCTLIFSLLMWIFLKFYKKKAIN